MSRHIADNPSKVDRIRVVETFIGTDGKPRCRCGGEKYIVLQKPMQHDLQFRHWKCEKCGIILTEAELEEIIQDSGLVLGKKVGK